MLSVSNSVGQRTRCALGPPRSKFPKRRAASVNSGGASGRALDVTMHGAVDASARGTRPTKTHTATNSVSHVAPVKRARIEKDTTPISVADHPIGADPRDGPSHTPTAPRLPQDTGLEDLAEKYTLGRILGSGTFGQVHRASDKQTGETVALKMINTDPTNRVEYGFPEAVLREIKILRQLRFHVNKPHPNIIMLRNIVMHRQKANTICLVMDYMDIDLQLLLTHYKRAVPHRVCQCYLYQLLNAINFVHNNNIIHRDLKPSNIVVNAAHQLKVVDWGLARVFRADKKIRYENSVCTAWYRSPELVLGADRTTHGYGPAIDMWSVGCIFVELLRREMGGRRLQRTLFDPRLDNPDGSGRLVLPPGFTTTNKALPTYLTSPNNLWRVITGKLGVPTAAKGDWPGCDQLKLWPEFSRMGLTSVDGHGSAGAKAATTTGGVGGGAANDRQTRRAEFEAELRIGAMSPEAIDLAVRLLELDPRQRITASAALSHQFFTGGLNASGQLVPGGAVAKPEDLAPLEGLDRAHSNKIKKEAEQTARKLGAGDSKVDNHWQDVLGED